MVVTSQVRLHSRGGFDVLEITGEVAKAVEGSKLSPGSVTVFCPGATGAVTTIEYENGVVQDLKQMLDEITPPDRAYHHHLRSGDDNGRSHIRAALVGPSLTVPFVDGKLTLGTWQKIVFCEFDTRPRDRWLVVQIIGE